MVLPEPPALRAGIVLERRGRRGRARRSRRGGARGGGGRGGMSRRRRRAGAGGGWSARDGECARLRGDRDVRNPVTGHDVGRCEREDAARGRRQGPDVDLQDLSLALPDDDGPKLVEDDVDLPVRAGNQVRERRCFGPWLAAAAHRRAARAIHARRARRAAVGAIRRAGHRRRGHERDPGRVDERRAEGRIEVHVELEVGEVRSGVVDRDRDVRVARVGRGVGHGQDVLGRGQRREDRQEERARPGGPALPVPACPHRCLVSRHRGHIAPMFMSVRSTLLGRRDGLKPLQGACVRVRDRVAEL